MQTHILIINRQLNFAVSIKQALERTGNFEVHPFTSLDPALDYLRGHMQDVALVDFTIPGVSGAEVVAKLREIQPKIALIATPRQPDELLAELGLQGTVNTPFTARELIPVVNKAIEGRRTGRLASDQARQRPGELVSREAPGQTRKGLLGIIDEQDAIRRVQTKPAESKPPDNLPEYTSIDNVLSTVAGTQALPPQPVEPPDEPPPPELEIVDEYEDDFEAPPIEELLEGIPPKPVTTLDDAAFSAMLDELDASPDTPVPTEFDELVNSMRDPAAQIPLPERHQQFVEFIVAGGAMDDLLEEIERKKTDELPELDPTVFDRAAEVDVEEPPPPEKPEMPVLPVIEEPQEEDEGTVGDIFTGVSDTSFRNVLSILRGEEPVEEDEGKVSEADMREAFPQFFASQPTDIDDILNQIETNAQREIIQTRDIGYDFDKEPPDEINTARLILQTALDESTPIDSFSISDLISNIEDQLPAHRPKVQPLPSWFRADRQRKEDDEKYVREPDFLPDVLPEFPPEAPDDELPELDFVDDWYDQTTRLSSAQQMAGSPEAMETEWLPAEFDAEPGAEGTSEEDDFFKYAAYAPQNAAPAQPDVEEFFGERTGDTRPIPVTDIEAAAEVPVEDSRQIEYDAYFERMADFRLEPEEAPLTSQHIDDPYIAQLALSLTEVSLELTAEATILTREGEIVAYAGRMAREELAEMRDAIGSDWDANPDEARIRFINLEGSGKDYMLYARRTVEDLTLSLVFSGTTSLRDIRRQGKRLVEALQAVPETIEEPVSVVLEDAVPPPVEDTTPRTPYAYVWMIRDPRSQLNNTTAQAIVSGMNVQLRERAWQVQEIHAKNDYVYLLAEVPGEVPPYDVVRELKRRSAHIAHAQNPTLDPDVLWADGYLVVTPGRRLDDDEIQQFIEFERM